MLKCFFYCLFNISDLTAGQSIFKRYTLHIGESIYGTRACFEPVDNVYVSTKKDNAIYIHILDCKEFVKLTLPAIDKKIVSAEVLKGEKLDFTQDDNGVKITLSEYALRNDAVDTVVKIITQ